VQVLYLPIMKHPGKILLLLVFRIIVLQDCKTQDIEPGSPYNAPVLFNPAMTGSHLNGLMVLSYRDFYPGNNFNIGSIYMSYDSYFEPVHGGLGLYLIENRLGNVLNDLRTGFTYAYHLRASRDLYINAGFMASLIHYGVNMNEIVFPDQIDRLLGPVLQTGESFTRVSRTVFDTGVGFLFNFREYHAGISVNHLASPDLSLNGNSDGRLRRRYSVHGSARFPLAGEKLHLAPLVYSSLQANIFSIAGGISLEYSVLALNLQLHHSRGAGINAIQTGIHLDINRIGVSYNYFFSPVISSGNLPVTLNNQVTLYIGLNNVDKSTVINTINYPKL